MLEYEQKQRVKEFTVFDTVKAEKRGEVKSQERRPKELAPSVKNMERWQWISPPTQRKFCWNRECLKRARHIGRKRLSPYWAQIVKMLRSLFLAYVEVWD